jgi:hypothetical protein
MAPSAQYKADAVENQPKRQACTKGTRKVVLNSIFEWAADPSSPTIFWLSGMAGSGKSTIAYTICEHFSKDGSLDAVLGASFFCSRQVASLRRLGNIVPTLAYQLARCFRSFAKHLDVVDRDVVNVSNEQVDKLLFGPWKASADEREAELPPTLIVIDALDEVEDEGGAEFLHKLLDATSQLSQHRNLQMKILVTSRPHPRIVQFGNQIGGDTVFRLEDIQDSLKQEDIMLFLKNELRDLAIEHQGLLQRLADRSDGLFIYAATVTRILTGNRSSKKSKREQCTLLEGFLDSVDPSSTTLNSASTTTLVGVYNLYKDVLNREIPSDMRSNRIPILHRIICAQQPMTIEALARLADVDSDKDLDVDACALLVESLHSVMYISKSDHCVYVYHKSFSDFMFDEGISGSDLACQTGYQHGALHRACLRILQTFLHFNMCSLPSSYLLDDEVPNIEVLVRDNIHAVDGLSYACRYWTFHLLEAIRINVSFALIETQLEQFLNEKALFWVEAMSLLKEGFSCQEGTRLVYQWIQKQVCCPTLHADAYLQTCRRPYQRA